MTLPVSRSAQTFFASTIGLDWPGERKQQKRQQTRLEPLKEAIDAILEADQQAPRKQRHTAHRIWAHLREEHPEHPIAEPTVRRYVQRRKRELGLGGRLVCVPQSYEFGQEAQVDWFEAVVKLDGEPDQILLIGIRAVKSEGGRLAALDFHLLLSLKLLFSDGTE